MGVLQDRSHCGACGNDCAAGHVCDGTGTCALSCQPGFVACGGECVNPDTDRRYCGASGDCTGSSAGVECADGLVCDGAGTCALSCQSGLLNCAGECVNPATDRRFCGASSDCTGPNAGTACADGFICDGSGTCALTCQAGLRNVGGVCQDIDECAEGTDTCSADALCVNSPGAFSCVGDDPQLCFDGVDDYGQSVPVTSAVASLGAATVELWFKATTNTGERQLFVFRSDDVNAARGVAASIVDASAQNFTSLTGRVLHLVIDARDNGGNLNARGFDLDATSPAFDEREWHHYAFVFDGTTQRAFVDGHELTIIQQRDGAPDTSFVDAFGPAYVSGGGEVILDVGWFPRLMTRYVAGQLEDFRVSGTARYGAPFSPSYPLGR